MRGWTWKHIVLGVLLLLAVVTIVIAILSTTGGGESDPNGAQERSVPLG